MRQYTREQFAEKLGADSDPKLNAAADFAARLLNGPLGDKVARIILFGSVARGEAKPESDIDLLVFSAAELGPMQEAVSDSAFATGLDWKQSVEPIVYGLSEMLIPDNWFVYRTLQVGKEIYRMNEEALRLRQAESIWGLARRYYAQAEKALSLTDCERLALDGAYNAAELAAKGLLALRLKDLPGSHGGVVTLFRREYVATGIVGLEYSSRLGKGLELRNKARYAPEAVITAEQAREVLSLAQELSALLEQKVREAAASPHASSASDEQKPAEE